MLSGIQSNNAGKVPNVPGATRASPVPKPNASRLDGERSRLRSLSGLLIKTSHGEFGQTIHRGTIDQSRHDPVPGRPPMTLSLSEISYRNAFLWQAMLCLIRQVFP